MLLSSAAACGEFVVVDDDDDHDWLRERVTSHSAITAAAAPSLVMQPLIMEDDRQAVFGFTSTKLWRFLCDSLTVTCEAAGQFRLN